MDSHDFVPSRGEEAHDATGTSDRSGPGAVRDLDPDACGPEGGEHLGGVAKTRTWRGLNDTCCPLASASTDADAKAPTALYSL